MLFFILIQILIEFLQANSGDSDQTPHFAASDLGLHCLPMSHKKDASLGLYGLTHALFCKLS